MKEELNHLGIDVGKRKCRAFLKNGKGKILDDFFFGEILLTATSLSSSAFWKRRYDFFCKTGTIVQMPSLMTLMKSTSISHNTHYLKGVLFLPIIKYRTASRYRPLNEHL